MAGRSRMGKEVGGEERYGVEDLEGGEKWMEGRSMMENGDGGEVRKDVRIGWRGEIGSKGEGG
jgi:hypothetical protein